MLKRLMCLIIFFLFSLNITNAHSSSIAINNRANKRKDLQMKKLDQASKELESVLASKLLDNMSEGVTTDKLFGGGQSEKIFRSLLNAERAKNIDLGLASSIKKQVMSLPKGERRNVKPTKRVQKEYKQ